MSVPNIMRLLCLALLGVGMVLISNLTQSTAYAKGLRFFVELAAELLILWAGAGLHAASVSEKAEKVKR